MIPEVGNREAFKRALFEMFGSPKKGETWFFLVPFIPANGFTQRIPVTISSVTIRRVRYTLWGDSTYTKGHMSINNFARMAVLGDVVLCTR